MADEIIVSIAAALAGKATGAAFGGLTGAWGRLARLVRDRFAHDDGGAAAALEAARERPADKVAVGELAEALERIVVADGDFAAELRALWRQARVELSASEGGVVNMNTGTVGGHLIQARDLSVEGGLHFGDVAGPADY